MSAEASADWNWPLVLNQQTPVSGCGLQQEISDIVFIFLFSTHLILQLINYYLTKFNIQCPLGKTEEGYGLMLAEFCDYSK
jgi:hypothetical protein